MTNTILKKHSTIENYAGKNKIIKTSSLQDQGRPAENQKGYAISRTLVTLIKLNRVATFEQSQNSLTFP